MYSQFPDRLHNKGRKAPQSHQQPRPDSLGKPSFMRLTTKGRVAVSAMIDLALRQGHGPVALATIGQRQRISLSYLEQLFSRLRRHQLVESTRGPGGGYTLGRKASAITVADIVFAIEDADPEPRDPRAGAEGRCNTEELWASLSRCAVDFLDSVTLQNLVETQRAKGVQLSTAEQPAVRRVPVTAPKRPRINAPNSVFALAAFAKR